MNWKKDVSYKPRLGRCDNEVADDDEANYDRNRLAASELFFPITVNNYNFSPRSVTLGPAYNE